MNNTKTFSFVIPDAIETLINGLSEKLNMNKSAVIRYAVTKLAEAELGTGRADGVQSTPRLQGSKGV